MDFNNTRNPIDWTNFTDSAIDWQTCNNHAGAESYFYKNYPYFPEEFQKYLAHEYLKKRVVELVAKNKKSKDNNNAV